MATNLEFFLNYAIFVCHLANCHSQINTLEEKLRLSAQSKPKVDLIPVDCLFITT